MQGTIRDYPITVLPDMLAQKHGARYRDHTMSHGAAELPSPSVKSVASYHA